MGNSRNIKATTIMVRVSRFNCLLASCFALLLINISNGFTIVTPGGGGVARLESTQLFFFGDALKGAFANDDNLGKAQNAGLSGGPKYNEDVTVNGKNVQGAVVGQKITVVAGRARVKVPVNCNKGDCGTCVVSLN